VGTDRRFVHGNNFVKPRVLIACSGVGHVARGYENASVELEQALRGHVDVTLLRGGGSWWPDNGVRLPCIQRLGGTARRLGYTGERAYLLEQRSFSPWLYAAARLLRADVVHLHDPGIMNAVWHARRAFGGSFAILFTNSGFLGPEHLRRPDLVHTVTPVDAERLAQAGYPPDSYCTIPYGIRPRAVPERSFAEGPPKRLVAVGALDDSQKGFKTAILAAAALAQTTTLRLIGQPTNETPEIEELGRNALGGRFSTETLPAEAVWPALADADAFILPTHVEGFCIAVLEAMAAGLPCVVSDIPVLKWLVADAAITVPPDRPDLWAAALRGLGPDVRRRLSAAGRQRAAEFQLNRLAPDYAAMYARAATRAQVR
jgi:1,2-diacylglycerol 3-alpha-glucosyltransferase